MVEEPDQKDEEVGRKDTLLRKKWVRLSIAVGAVLAVALLVSLGFALRWYLSPQTDLSISQRQDLVQGLASAGQALAVLLTGAVGLIGLYLTRQNTNKQLRQARESTQEQLQQTRESQERTQASAQETLRLTEQGQITERFTRAIEQLGATDDKGKKKLEIRLGGIYALERIARDSPERDYSTVMEVLTAYVRENTPQAPEPSNGAELAAPPEPRRPTADLQAILDVLSRTQASVPEEYRTRLDLREANLYGANLYGANLYGAKLQRANLQDANLQDANLQDANLQDANLQDADLERADLQRADLQRADLQRAGLQGANLQDADLQDADLRRALLRGATRTNLYGAYLSGANLSEAYLSGANLQRADLDGANLQRADLDGANLQRADLPEANLKRANLQYANLQDADLQRADLQGANLQYANLQDANLQDANFHGLRPELQRADLKRADLQGAKITDEQLAPTLSLQGATMPDGSKHP